jgi:hypothetical protein
MHEEGSNDWLSFLPDAVELYNESEHANLQGQSPDDAYESSDLMSLAQKHAIELDHNDAAFDAGNDIQPGDKVRIREAKVTFAKEGPRWSGDVYTVKGRDGNRFLVVDVDGVQLRRRFRPAELLKVTASATRVAKPGARLDAGARQARRLRREGLPAPAPRKRVARKSQRPGGVDTARALDAFN